MGPTTLRIIVGLMMAHCAYAAYGPDMQKRHITKAVEAFYELISDDNFERADFIEIMDYIAERFHHKCYFLSDTTSINPGEVLQVVDGLEREMNKLSSEIEIISEDQKQFHNEIGEVTNDQKHFHEEVRTKMTEITESQTHFRENIEMISKELKEYVEEKLHFLRENYVSTKALCSVETYEKHLTGDYCISTSIRNLALGKPAWQSSEHYNGDVGKASAAVDGNRDSNFLPGKSCIHTKKEMNPWWKVDLEVVSLVGRVVIVNRDDREICGQCGGRLRHVVVTLSAEQDGAGEVCGRFAGPGSAGQIIEIKCPKQIFGRYVKVQMNSDNYLNICEVEVYSQ